MAACGSGCPCCQLRLPTACGCCSCLGRPGFAGGPAELCTACWPACLSPAGGGDGDWNASPSTLRGFLQVAVPLQPCKTLLLFTRAPGQHCLRILKPEMQDSVPAPGQRRAATTGERGARLHRLLQGGHHLHAHLQRRPRRLRPPRRRPGRGRRARCCMPCRLRGTALRALWWSSTDSTGSDRVSQDRRALGITAAIVHDSQVTQTT